MTENDKLIELKQQIRDNWVTLKDESQSKKNREKAAKNIIELSIKAHELDETFEVLDIRTTRYAEFVPENVKIPNNGESIWPVLDKNERRWAKVVKETYYKYLALAVEIVRERYPNLEQKNTNLFGQIVNATTHNLIVQES